MTAEEMRDRLTEASATRAKKIRKPKLQAFRFTFEGMALGGEAVVIAANEIEAQLELMSLYPEIEGVELDADATKPAIGVVHFWDGDY